MAKVGTVPTIGLVGRWDLDGNALDTSGSGNNGTATNVTYTGTDRGYQGQAGVFNGSSSYVSGSGVNIANSDFTISSWFNCSGGTGNQDIFTIGNTTGSTRKDFYLRVKKGTNELAFGMYGDDWAVSNTVTNGTYYHFLGKFNTTTKVGEMFLNGVSIGTHTFGGAFTGGTNWNISQAVWSPGFDFFQGNIQSVRVFNRAISTQEIDTLYKEGMRKLAGSSLAPLTDGLVAYWDMNGDAQDIVGGNVLTVGGTPAFGITDYLGNIKGVHLSSGGYYTSVSNFGLGTNKTFNLAFSLNSVSSAYKAIFAYLFANPSWIRFYVNNANINIINRGISAFTFTTGVVYFATITFDGTNCLVYINGNLIFNASAGGEPTSNNSFRLPNDYAPETHDCNIFFFEAYNGIKSASEVLTLYNLSKERYLTHLLH